MKKDVSETCFRTSKQVNELGEWIIPFFPKNNIIWMQVLLLLFFFFTVNISVLTNVLGKISALNIRLHIQHSNSVLCLSLLEGFGLSRYHRK